MSDKIEGLFTWRSAFMDKNGPPSTTRLVLLAISLHMTEKGESSFPSYALLASETGLTKRSCMSHVQKACELGWLEVKKRTRDNGSQSSNLYQPCVPGGVNEIHQGGEADDTPYSTSFSSSPKSSNRESAHAREAPEQPSLEEVKQYASMNAIPEQLAEKFFYHYESEGWETRRGKVMRWQPRLQKWKVEQHKYSTNAKPTHKQKTNVSNSRHSSSSSDSGWEGFIGA